MVEFNVSGSGVLTVDSDTLYVDNGNSSDGYYDQTMGVYLDMGLGLSSALIPSQNTVILLRQEKLFSLAMDPNHLIFQLKI